jgi:glycosyltransferase involved in cell wall biosynthesis
MPVRVLFLRSNPISPDPRVEKEAAALAKAGFNVSALAWDRSGALPVVEKRGDLTVSRLLLKAEYGQGMGNLTQLLRWQSGLLVWLISNRRKYDILHACDFDTVLPALFCRLLYRKPVVYDIFDFYADHLRSTPKFIKSIIRQVDLDAVRRADAVILVDEVRKIQLGRARPKRLEVVTNSPADQRDLFVQESSPKGKLRIAYVGLLLVERGLLELIQVLKHRPEWQLDLAGFGGDAGQILAAVEGMPNITFHGQTNYEQTLSISARSDCLIATYDPLVPNHRLASPNKLFEAMMLGKPVLVARGTHMDTIVQEHDCGVVVNYGETNQLDGALSSLADDPHWRELLGANARSAYDRVYSWDRMEERLVCLYRQVLDCTTQARHA